MPKASDDRLTTLRRRIGKVSTQPGIYKWLNKDGDVLYVGKAKNLRNRLRNYVQPNAKHSAWKDMLVRQITDFDVTLTNTELEALMLETNLIKELKPKYNIMMKDDKHYVYLRITVQDPYPRIDIVRKMEEDGAMYFGPKTSADQIRRSLKFLRKLFPYRTCKMTIEPKESSSEKLPIDVVCTNRDRPTPCLDHHIKQCTAPCIGKVTPEQYRKESIDGIIAFFEGDHDTVIAELRRQMEKAAIDKKFERAAQLRDQLQTMQDMQEQQMASDTSRENADIIGVAVETGRAFIVLMQQRNGKIIAEETFNLLGNADSPGEVLTQFLPQYYGSSADLPDHVLLSDEPDDREIIQEWLSVQHDRSIDLRVPQRGRKSKLLLLAEKNARWKAQQSLTKWESEAQKVEDALSDLQTLLDLPEEPKRIEGYDISHLGGTETVGSMVVFYKGKAKNDHYRSFTIRTLEEGAVDDYKALQEVLRRRLLHLVRNVKEEEKVWKEKGCTFGKARKAELEFLEKTTKQNTIAYKQFLVARNEESIIAFAELHAHKGGTIELRSLWHDKEHNDALEFVCRKLLHSVKKGKVYVVTDKNRYNIFADMGFREVHQQPDVLPKGEMTMVYIVSEHKQDASLSARPDLLLIDGGKGQLNAVTSVMQKLNITIPVIGLAKREEEIFVPGESLSLDVPKDSQGRFLLQRVRDEAHRFANRHREQRGWKATIGSSLDGIPGVGEKSVLKLRERFGSVSAVRNASDEDLLTILSETQLRALRKALGTS